MFMFDGLCYIWIKLKTHLNPDWVQIIIWNKWFIFNTRILIELKTVFEVDRKTKGMWLQILFSFQKLIFSSKIIRGRSKMKFCCLSVFFLLLISLINLSRSQHHDNVFAEELVLRELDKNFVNSYFQFTTKWVYSSKDDCE